MTEFLRVIFSSNLLSIYQRLCYCHVIQMRMREVQFDEDILELKRQATGQARSNLQENIDLMRLQREVKDKSTKLSAMQAQFENLSSVSFFFRFFKVF